MNGLNETEQMFIRQYVADAIELLEGEDETLISDKNCEMTLQQLKELHEKLK